jgi:luciferase family oxidoreductase group 1
MLGSSRDSALWAAQLGLPYAFADFINPRGAEIAALYRERFAEHEHARHPRTAVAVWVVCADTDEEAQRLASSARMSFTLLRRGQLIPVPPPEKAIRFLQSDQAQSDPAQAGPRSERRAIIGSPATVAVALREVVSSYGAEEAIVVTITYDHDARARSYELLAEAFL